MNDVIIRTDNLTKTYGTGAAASHALRGVTTTIPAAPLPASLDPRVTAKAP
jgi:putative ABC transport system ATP-binding protein